MLPDFEHVLDPKRTGRIQSGLASCNARSVMLGLSECMMHRKARTLGLPSHLSDAAVPSSELSKDPDSRIVSPGDDRAALPAAAC